jgi:hypothetical protein
MSVELIDLGLLPNDGTGSPLRIAFERINNNFGQMAGLGASGNTGEIQINNADAFFSDPSFSYDVNTGILTIGTTIVPVDSANATLGSLEHPFNQLYLSQAALSLGNVNVSESNGAVSFYIANTTTLADFTINNISSNNIVSTGTISYGNATVGSVVTTTPNNNTNQTIFQIPADRFVSGTIEVNTLYPEDRSSQTVTLAVTTTPDRTDLRYVAYGTTFVGNCLTRYNVLIASDNVRVTVSPLINAPMTHTITYRATQ